jgi:hypothetical protein
MTNLRSLALVVTLIGFAVVYGVSASPYVIHSSLQYTGYVTDKYSLSSSQVSPPIDLYLTPGVSYFLYLVTHYKPTETYAVISTDSISVGALVFVNSTLGQWYVQSSPPPISISTPVSYDRIMLASSLKEVASPLSDNETYLTQTSEGQLILQLSSLVLALPLVLVLLVRVVARRFALWSVVLAIWFVVATIFAADEVGSGYGTAASTSLEIGLVGLLVGVYVISRLENYVRLRLGASSRP